MNDRPHNKNLDDLFKSRLDKNSGELDDFEHEALEGFESLGTEEKARELKNELDRDIHSKLFLNENKGPKIYWFAAAGLFLVIGLTVFFILNNRPLEDKNVAAIKQDEIKPSTEEIISPPPTEEKDLEIKESSPAKSVAGTPKEQSDNERNNNISSRAVLKPSQKSEKENSDDIIIDENKKGDYDSKDIIALEAEQKPLVDKVIEDESKKLEEQSKIATSSKTKSADKFAVAESGEREELKKEYKEKDKETGKKKSSKADNAPKGKLSTEKSAEEPNTSVAQNTSNTDLKNNGTANGVIVTAPSSANSPGSYRADEYNSPTNQVYYTGGEDALVKDVREKLSAVQINKKFNALLIVNEKKQVEKVNYLNVYDLTTAERDKVTEILKALTKFNFYIQPNKKGLFEFKLNYKP
jgi:hypothetical protein